MLQLGEPVGLVSPRALKIKKTKEGEAGRGGRERKGMGMCEPSAVEEKNGEKIIYKAIYVCWFVLIPPIVVISV